MKKTKKRLFLFLAVAVLIIFFSIFLFFVSKSRNFQFFGELLTSIPNDDNKIALTFDDGPTENTAAILYKLDELEIKAAFFVCGVGIDARLGDAKGNREVTRAYISDADGNETGEGKYATLEMKIGPDISLGSPINYNMATGYNGWVDCDYTITQQKDILTESGSISGIMADQPAGEIKILLDDFTVSEGTYDGITMKYAGYALTQDGKHPLLIWLHGAGEGGKDGLLPIAGNKAANFASKEIQAYFGGAYILAPQSPTIWMDGETGFGDGTSIYGDALMELIQDYVAGYPGIDTDRIYIGGDSNGGYMTMLMARDHTGYSAAAFPTCESLRDSLISDTDIQKLKGCRYGLSLRRQTPLYR